jgi:hypothetical protein
MIEEMTAVVQVYIHIRKNVEVKIQIRNGRDILKLQKAYAIAQDWMAENNCKIVIV